MSVKLENARREYRFGRLTRALLHTSPIVQLDLWLKQAVEAGAQDPTAMSLATVGAEGHPWQRIVLLKHLDDRGLVFFTNLGSRKARDIAANPRVSVLFPWLQLDRQVIVAGRAERVSTADTWKYFLTRPRESQLAAWSSRQSSRLSSRQVLEAQWLAVKERFADGEIPLPDFWGGYRILPTEFEFWQGGERRLHDRFQYLPDEQGRWQIERLAP